MRSQSLHPVSLSEGGSLAILRPNPAFMPMIITSSFKSRVITLENFLPPSYRNEEEESHRYFYLRDTSEFSLTHSLLSELNDQQNIYTHFEINVLMCVLQADTHSASPLNLFVRASGLLQCPTIPSVCPANRSFRLRSSTSERIYTRCALHQPACSVKLRHSVKLQLVYYFRSQYCVVKCCIDPQKHCFNF